jgi:adenine-specific DNA-methyltransferase
MDKLNMQTTNNVDENIKRIGELFPNCLTERLDENGRPETAIDFDLLRQELSKSIVEGPEERYQFTWPDKRNAIRLANAPTTDTLRPCREESVDFDTTQNLYIEGDNLQVLKLLRENYLGKVKMIYIDPPYNTGNDFVYNDDFSTESSEFRTKSGDFDESGNQIVDRMTLNTESNGRFHTDWLNMIYPRLKVAKDLLSEDGVIFISIDDHEVENLKKVCDEIYGCNNFVSCLIWEKKFSPQNDDKYITAVHDYILLYAKSKQIWRPQLQSRSDNALNKFKNPDNDPRGVWTSGDLTSKTKASGHSYEIISPSGKKFLPPEGRQWAPAYDTYIKLRNDNRLWFGENGDNVPRQKQFLSEIQNGVVPTSILFHKEVGHNQGAKQELLSIIPGIGNTFETPKPTTLIQKLLNLVALKNNDVILDFFSGSSTTAHAVMLKNAEDVEQLAFIMVQIDEPIVSSSFKSICEIGKERIRRAGKKILEEQQAKQADLFSGEQKPLDIGFRVLKLDSSNMQDVYYSPEQFNENLLFEDNIKPDRTEEDLLFQAMIELGIELSAKIEKQELAGKTVWSVANGYLMACFDTDVNETTITEIARQKPYYFVMRDSSLATDNVADNFEQIWEEYSKETVRRIL